MNRRLLWVMIALLGPTTGWPLAETNSLESPREIKARDRYLEQLSHDDWRRRLESLARLRRSGQLKMNPSLVNAVVNLLKDTREDIRKEAVALLGDWQAVTAIPALQLLLQDSSAILRQRTVSALEAMAAPAALTALGSALKNRDPLVRLSAAGALSRFALPGATPYLIHALQRDGDVRVQAAAAEGLAGQGGDAYPVLEAALKGPDRAVGEALLNKLLTLNDPNALSLFLTALRHRDAGLRRLAVLGLGRTRDPQAFTPLIRQYQSASDAEMKIAVLDSLGVLGHLHALTLLTLASREGPPPIRLAAVRALGQLKDPQTQAALVAVLPDRDPTLRLEAVRGLALLPPALTAEALTRMTQDPDPDVRSQAAAALGLSQGEDALFGLCGLARGPRGLTPAQWTQQVSALLQDHPPLSSTAQLSLSQTAQHVLSRPMDIRSRVQTIALLSHAGAAGAAVLGHELESGPASTRKEVIKTLGMTRNADGVAWLVKAIFLDDPLAQSLALNGLQRLERSLLLPALRPILRHPQVYIRLTAVTWVGQRKALDHAGDLADLLARDADARVRAEAARILGDLGEADSIPALQRALHDPAPSVQAAARAALDNMGETSDGLFQRRP